MPEVFEVADRIEVLRLGTRVARFRRGEVTMEDVVGAMTGAITHDDGDRPEAEPRHQKGTHPPEPDAPRR
jgi:ABC-type sugar transport system ATPase subunit